MTMVKCTTWMGFLLPMLNGIEIIPILSAPPQLYTLQCIDWVQNALYRSCSCLVLFLLWPARSDICHCSGIVRLWGLASDLIKRRGTTSVTSIYILLLLLQCFNWKTSSGFWLSLLVGTLHRGEPMVVILSPTDIIITCSTLSPSNLFMNNNLRY